MALYSFHHNSFQIAETINVLTPDRSFSTVSKKKFRDKKILFQQIELKCYSYIYLHFQKLAILSLPFLQYPGNDIVWWSFEKIGISPQNTKQLGNAMHNVLFFSLFLFFGVFADVSRHLTKNPLTQRFFSLFFQIHRILMNLTFLMPHFERWITS